MGALAAVLQRFQPGANARRIGCIGMECALNAVHLVQLAADSQGAITVHAMASQPYPCTRDELFASPRQFRALVRTALAQGNFRGRAIVTTLPSSDVNIMPVSYHVAEGGTDDAALLGVMAERLDGDLSNYVIDYLPVRSERGMEERQAIVAVAQRDFVINYLELLRKSGLETRHLEIGPSAIRRLVSAMGTQGEHHNVLAINFGRESSFLTVISGARLLFDQEIPFGENRLLNLVATTLELPVESVSQLIAANSLDPWVKDRRSLREGMDREASLTLQEIVKPEFLKLVEEINRTLIYAASQTRGESVTRIYLLGSLARWQGADALLHKLVNLDVETIPDPFRVFCKTAESPSPATVAPSPEIAVATGLAMNGLTEHD
ncbi:MAG: pilus assembly protein PilM [Gammaproteobacteria bacterium]